MQNNRFWNAKNPNQGEFMKTLVVCSAGLLRSPTLAWILANEPFSMNTRAAGSTKTFALIHADDVLLHWADLVVFVNNENFKETQRDFPEELAAKDVIILDLPDCFQTRDPELISIATQQFTDAWNCFDN